MRWLIVTADELGLSSKRNQGIVDAHTKGIVTSASMLAYGPAFREAVKIAKGLPKLDIGLHLNLSEGEPLVLGHKTLVNADGAFWGRQEARKRAREGVFDLREVEREADAQIETLKSAGIKVTNLSSVDHVHIRGNLAQSLALVCKKHGIRCFRCPADKVRPPSLRLDADRSAAVEEYHQSALSAVSVYAAQRMRSTENFGGAALTGHLTPDLLLETLRSLPVGLTELMVHPGLKAAASGFEGPDRELELKALTDPRLKAVFQELQIGLTSFAKL
ncbi:MAG: ChbG/HpnK family deacetylase [Planctomycetaceae bacterium]|nr:ChbG/HpnK family deacetylase [Planctomycetaceae bacterium]